MLSIVVITLLAFFQPMPMEEEGEEALKLVPTSVDACALAWQDIQTVAATDREFIRYVWVDSADVTTGMTYAWNAATSKSANPLRPDLLTHNSLPLTVLRYDLRRAAPNDINELKHLVAAWERLVFIEWSFHATITVPRFRDATGAWNTRQIVYGPFLGVQGKLLQAATNSFVPIVRGDWLQVSMLTTLGTRGRYYDFANVNNNQGKYFLSRGLDENFLDKLNSENRAAINRSKITRHPRGVELAQGSGVPLTRGTGLVAITYDPGRENLSPFADPKKTLLGIDSQDENGYKAREVILEKRNGYHEFTLWNNKKALQLSVPPDVATDDFEPAGGPRELQPGIGCIRCHGQHDGWQPLENNVRDLLRAGGVDIFGQQSRKRNLYDTVGLIADKYSGDLNPPLQRARDTYNQVVFETVGKPVMEVSKIVADNYEHYLVDLVTSKKAARDMGFDVSDAAAPALLQRLWPTPEVGEDTTAIDLKAGLGVNRFQWELFYPDAMTRMQASLLLNN